MGTNIGIIGVGHFAGYLVEGFLNKCPENKFILSPRGKEQAKIISEKFGCEVAADNQDVINKSDIIIICVKPEHVEGVLNDGNFNENQIVISVASGVSYEVIKSGAFPAKAARALPISSAAINQSPTLLYPNSVRAKEILSFLGPVYLMENEDQFTAAAAYSAFYGWGFKFVEEMVSWGTDKGLNEDTTRKMVQTIFSGMAGMAEKDQDVPMSDIVTTLATKGGITELGLKVIEGKSGFDVWHEAMDAVVVKLSGK